MAHPGPRGASPRDSSRHYPRPEPGLLDHCQHESVRPCLPSPGMSPVATGSGGPSGLEDSLHSLARENGKRARSPQIKSVLCCTQAGEPTGNDSHYAKRDSGAKITAITNLN